MKRILLFALVSILYGCNGDSNKPPEDSDLILKNRLDSGIVKCPYGHTDSIVPIIYGYPSEEDFQKSDSGLIALGGCMLPENPSSWFCKIHDRVF